MINSPDSFIYNFIFDLGKFFPFKISLLGGRFFASYSEKAVLVNDTFFADYKNFLHENLSLANSFDSIQNSTPINFINWIKYFIEHELINIEYRDIYKKFLSSDGQTTFSFCLFHTFFDIFFFESISLAKKIDSFICRLQNLPKYFLNIQEQLDQIPFTSILELSYSSSVINDYFIFIEESISDLNINLKENLSYIDQKNNLIQFFTTFRIRINETLQNYSFLDINYELRKETFFKTVEYNLSKTKINIESDLEKILFFKNSLVAKYVPMLKLDVSTEQLPAELLKISKKTKILSNAIQAQYQKIFDEITKNLITPFTTKDKTDLLFQTINQKTSVIAFNNLFISLALLKRNSRAKFISTNELTTFGTIFLTTLTEIIPYIYFLETVISSSYVYSVLRFPETEQALKMFLIYFYLQIDNQSSLDVKATLVYQLIFISEISILDLTLHSDTNFNRAALVQTIQHKFAKNELESEKLLEHLLNLPGFYYTSFIVLQSLINRFEIIKNNYSKELAIQKVLSLIKLIYGAPPKLALQEIEKIT